MNPILNKRKRLKKASSTSVQRPKGSGEKAAQRRDRFELKPYGLVGGLSESHRPVFLFKEVDGEAILPVSLDPVEVGVISGSARVNDEHSHGLSQLLFNEAGIEIVECEFLGLRRQVQQLRVSYRPVGSSGQKKITSCFLECSVDQGLSLCFLSKTPFFAERQVVEESRAQEVEAQSLEAQLQGLPMVFENPHPYLM